MKERPLLLVKDLRQKAVAGLKTQTRRIIKPQPIFKDKMFELKNCQGMAYQFRSIAPFYAPYAVGDRLYQQEPYKVMAGYNTTDGYVLQGIYCDDKKHFNEFITKKEAIKFCKRKYPHRATSARFMYKSLARWWYVVTGVRVEQVQDISEEDALAEGIEAQPPSPNLDAGLAMNWGIGQGRYDPGYKFGFKKLWNSTYGPDAWARNDWVWVTEFKRIEVSK
jgi:hypothetical protein